MFILRRLPAAKGQYDGIGSLVFFRTDSEFEQSERTAFLRLENVRESVVRLMKIGLYALTGRPDIGQVDEPPLMGVAIFGPARARGIRSYVFI